MKKKVCKGFLILWISLITCIFTQCLLISAESEKINVEKITTNIIKSKNKYLDIDIKIPILESENIKYISDEINNWTLGWISDAELVVKEYQKQGEDYTYPFQFYADYNITENNGEILSFYIDYYQFTGGAHGMTKRIAYNLDRRTGKILNLDNLFVEDYDYKTIINKEIRKQINGEKEKYFDEGAMFKGINDKTNYYLTKGYLVIYYGAYEIGPYSSGILEFKIPLSLFGNKFIYDNMNL